jgi:hypothetical protein
VKALILQSAYEALKVFLEPPSISRIEFHTKTPLLFRETREVSGKSSGVFGSSCAAFAWKKAARGGEKSICGENAHQCGHHT